MSKTPFLGVLLVHRGTAQEYGVFLMLLAENRVAGRPQLKLKSGFAAFQFRSPLGLIFSQPATIASN
jgi:hypothetical protein